MTRPSRAIFASGCFWGTQHYLGKAEGVMSTRVGYTGGDAENPTYDQVLTGRTGHVEAVEVIFDSGKISYEDLAKIFFETHDSTQIGGQGPDIGTQYKSVIFYLDKIQKETAERLIEILRKKGIDVATELRPAKDFFVAEQYHQNYYQKSGGSPYCHFYRKLFYPQDRTFFI